VFDITPLIPLSLIYGTIQLIRRAVSYSKRVWN